MSRKKPAVPVTVVRNDDDLPDALKAGPCIEVWARAGSREPHLEAHERFGAARRAWLLAHGLNLHDRNAWPTSLRRSRAPWSFDRMALNEPARLVVLLERLHLPAAWQPTCVSTRTEESR